MMTAANRPTNQRRPSSAGHGRSDPVDDQVFSLPRVAGQEMTTSKRPLPELPREVGRGRSLDRTWINSVLEQEDPALQYDVRAHGGERAHG